VYPDHFFSPWSRPNFLLYYPWFCARCGGPDNAMAANPPAKLPAPHYYLLFLIVLPPFATLSPGSMSQAYVSSCHDVICLGGWLDKVSSHTMHSTATAILPSLPLPATFQKVEDRSASHQKLHWTPRAQDHLDHRLVVCACPCRHMRCAARQRARLRSRPSS
jgi:hypothetical protein